jgi:hypothetical protein
MELTGVALSTAHRDLVEIECALPVICEEFHQKPWPKPQKRLRLANRHHSGPTATSGPR